MKNNPIDLKTIYGELETLKIILEKKGIIDKTDLSAKTGEIIWDWPEQVTILADESLLGEDWLSKEDEEAWKDL